MYFTKMQLELLGSELWMLVHWRNQWEGKSPSLKMLYWISYYYDTLWSTKSPMPVAVIPSSYDSTSIQPWMWNPFQGIFMAKLDLLTYLYLLTYSMVQSPSWEANWFAVSQEIPRISRNPKVYYRTHNPPPPVPILGQHNPVHIPTSHFLEIIPNII